MFNHLRFIPTLSYRGRQPSIMEREAMRRRVPSEADRKDRQATADHWIAEYTAKIAEWKAKSVAEIQKWYEKTLYYRLDFRMPTPLSDADVEKVRAERIKNCESRLREWQLLRPE